MLITLKLWSKTELKLGVKNRTRSSEIHVGESVVSALGVCHFQVKFELRLQEERCMIMTFADTICVVISAQGLLPLPHRMTPGG